MVGKSAGESLSNKFVSIIFLFFAQTKGRPRWTQILHQNLKRKSPFSRYEKKSHRLCSDEY